MTPSCGPSPRRPAACVAGQGSISLAPQWQQYRAWVRFTVWHRRHTLFDLRLAASATSTAMPTITQTAGRLLFSKMVKSIAVIGPDHSEALGGRRHDQGCAGVSPGRPYKSREHDRADSRTPLRCSLQNPCGGWWLLSQATRRRTVYGLPIISGREGTAAVVIPPFSLFGGESISRRSGSAHATTTIIAVRLKADNPASARRGAPGG